MQKVFIIVGKVSSKAWAMEGTEAIRSGLGSLFHGVGSVCHAISDGFGAISEMAPPPLFAYYDATRWGWGYPHFYSPVVSYMPPVFYAENPTVVTATAPQTGFAVQQNPYQFNYTPLADNGPFFPIAGEPSSLNALCFGAPNFSVPGGSSIQNTSNFLENMYNPNGSKNDSSTKPEDKPITLMDKTGKLATPDWYKSIIAEEENGKDKKKTLSAGQKRMKDNFADIHRKYGVYMLDGKTLDIKVDAQGNPVKSHLYNELLQLRNLLTSGNTTSAEAYLNKCNDDKLAAIEIHYEREFGVPLRKAMKDCGEMWGLGWTNYNPEWAERQMNRLDKAAMKSPENMVAAFIQATENHNWCGFGLDDKRMVKLLKMMLPNGDDSPEEKAYKMEFKKAFLGAFDMEHINKKWFNKDEVMHYFNQLLTCE